jgi:hypothetical protein
MESSSNMDRLNQALWQEVQDNFDTDRPTARRLARDLLRRPLLAPITRAMCNLLMVYLVGDVDVAQRYLDACRDALAFNLAIGRDPPGIEADNDIAECEAYLRDRRDHPENYDLSDDEDDGLSHEAWLQFYLGDHQSAESDEPGAEYELTDALTSRISDDVDDADEDDDEEEPAALPTSDARFMRSSSRPAEDDSATSAFDPQSDAPYGLTDAPDEPEP